MAISLQADFRDFLKLLIAHGVQYLIVGGYAVNLHGYYRSTADLDVWIEVSPENAEKVAAAVREFGFREATGELFLRTDKITRLGPQPVCIEIFGEIPGVKFRPCYGKRERMLVDKLLLDVISLKDLQRNKTVAGRLKDQADVHKLAEQERLKKKRKRK